RDSEEPCASMHSPRRMPNPWGRTPNPPTQSTDHHSTVATVFQSFQSFQSTPARNAGEWQPSLVSELGLIIRSDIGESTVPGMYPQWLEAANGGGTGHPGA